jgi:hypothetical protein
VPAPLLDLQRVVATHGHPRRAGRSQVVPSERLAGRRAFVQFRAIDALCRLLCGSARVKACVIFNGGRLARALGEDALYDAADDAL